MPVARLVADETRPDRTRRLLQIAADVMRFQSRESPLEANAVQSEDFGLRRALAGGLFAFRACCGFRSADVRCAGVPGVESPLLSCGRIAYRLPRLKGIMAARLQPIRKKRISVRLFDYYTRNAGILVRYETGICDLGHTYAGARCALYLCSP